MRLFFRLPRNYRSRRPYVLVVMFLLPLDLRAPLADRHKTLHSDQYLRRFYNASPKFQVALLSKTLGANNMQNLARFYTTSDFDREYLCNDLRYPTSESQLIEVPHSAKQVRWTLVHYPERLACEFGPEIFTRARYWPRIHSTHNKSGWGYPKNFNCENLKLGLKFHICTPITLG